MPLGGWTEWVAVRAMHQDSFRSGEWAMICGLRMSKPDREAPWRLCYLIEFSDGIRDLVPVDGGHELEFSCMTPTAGG
jgi:hypothetical protein